MEVQVVSGGSGGFNALMYGEHSPNMRQYLANSVNKATLAIGEIGANFVQAVGNLHEKYNGNAAVNYAKQIIHSAGDSVNQNVVIPLTMDMMPQANNLMQHYIMSHPGVNELYNDNMINGYESSWVDQEPDVVGEDRIHYKNAMSGVLQHDDSGEAFYNTYSDEQLTELDSLDQQAILSVWTTLDAMLLEDIDPTDPGCG